ncbi:hypothetical protein TNCV_4422601 [Trichonephila clavipes]|nr:hypothetical protein TNCV_4422601 [Trichonephila clavipes]
MDNGIERHLLHWCTPLLHVTSRWSDLSMETQWGEAVELLRYASPPWSCTRFMLAQRIFRDTPSTATPEQLCHGQESRTTPELTSVSPKLHITPTGVYLNSERFNLHQHFCRAVVQWC